MTEQEFQLHCDRAMDALYKAVLAAADHHDFEADQNAGTVTLEFEEPYAKFVVSPNSPVRQIWVSALTQSFKLSWDASRAEFVLPDGRSLRQLMADAIGQQINEPVEL